MSIQNRSFYSTQQPTFVDLLPFEIEQIVFITVFFQLFNIHATKPFDTIISASKKEK
jgi:hypothetical protein